MCFLPYLMWGFANMNSEEKKTPTFRSIFCSIKEKPNSDYPANSFFKEFTFDSISYPESLEIVDGKNYSLLDESRIFEAKDTCQTNPENKERPYLLVSVDLSGIQDTVYTISSKGALKSLRARSFMLEFLCEHICYELITACIGDYKEYKNRSHIVFSGGGSLCLLLPNNTKTRKAINDLKLSINNWVFDEFSGRLYIAIAYSELSDTNLSDVEFKKTWKELADKLTNDKRRKFSWKLELIFDEKFLKDPTLRSNAHECQICHRDDIDPDKELYMRILETGESRMIKHLQDRNDDPSQTIVHELCYQLYEVGKKLTNFRYISRLSNIEEIEKRKGCLKFRTKDDEEVYYVLGKANNSDCLWELNILVEKDGALPFFYANYNRKIADLQDQAKKVEVDTYCKERGKKSITPGELKDLEESTASFAGLANSARGAKLIGCLRMDIDNMGRIITEQLEPFTLANFSNLSKMLNIFFKVYLNKICKGDLGENKKNENIGSTDLTEKTEKNYNGRNVSIVYAGGMIFSLSAHGTKLQS